MARTRLINPDAPKDEAVATLSPLARVTWAYLPCHADREGRLEDKPFKLKFEILPADNVSMDELLDELEAGHLIHRFVAGGRRFIQIRTFLRHQNPHKNERASVIPPPDATPAPEHPDDSGQVASHPEPLAKVPEPSLQKLSARAVSDPDPVPASDPVSESFAHTAGVRDPSSTAPAGPPAALHVRPWTAQRLLDLFGDLREKLHPNTLAWHAPAGKSREKASDFLAAFEHECTTLEAIQALGDIEPTMRRYLQQVRDSQDERDRDPSWLFSCWISKFTALREQVHGLRAPADAPKDRDCEFHDGGRNRGKPARKENFKKTCPECRHVYARASPRAPSEPTSVSDLVEGLMPGR
jgi:hypothetical protein